jgi:serine protease Do
MRNRRLFYLPIIFSLMLFFAVAGCNKKETASEVDRSPQVDRTLQTERFHQADVTGFLPSFADLVEQVAPAVVNISTVTVVRVPGTPWHFFGHEEEGQFREFFRRFFGDIPDRELRQRSLGSGFLIDAEGHIITNNHVVARAEEIVVRMADGREFKANVIGRDPRTDIALIKISPPVVGLPFLPFGDSDRIRVGDWVLAIGNPFGLEHTVTKGIISATGRVIGAGPYDNFLQTDTPINPGNSGGPLINLRGEAIGINAAIIPAGQGIGFAIPSNMAEAIIKQLKDKGRVIRGWIGVSVQTITPEIMKHFGLKDPKGALIVEVMPRGPADRAGIKRGDVIIMFDGREIEKIGDLTRFVAETYIGKSVDVKVIRDRREINLKVTVVELKDNRR